MTTTNKTWKRGGKNVTTGQAVEWNGEEYLVDSYYQKGGAEHYVYDSHASVGQVSTVDGVDIADANVRLFSSAITGDDLRAIVESL